MSDKITWSGDLADDCRCEWRGLRLHAEAMNSRLWWWAVYAPDDGPGRTPIHGGVRYTEVASSSESSERPQSGRAARRQAEEAARKHGPVQPREC